MKLGYYSTSDPDILSIAEEVEYDLFTTTLRNPQHVLQPTRTTSAALALSPQKGSWALLLNNNSRELVPITNRSGCK